MIHKILKYLGEELRLLSVKLGATDYKIEYYELRREQERIIYKAEELISGIESTSLRKKNREKIRKLISALRKEFIIKK